MINNIPSKKNKLKKDVLIVSAPSGAGKSTIVSHLLKEYDIFDFSISATSRKPRGEEVHGKEYFFLSEEEFKKGIEEDRFVEYEEVYPGLFYGTLRSEVDRIWKSNKVIVFDIDVMGGMNLRKLYAQRALSLFIAPPSIEVLRERLINRKTDTPEAIEKRVAKAEKELAYAANFDKLLVNDRLEDAFSEADKFIEENYL